MSWRPTNTNGPERPTTRPASPQATGAPLLDPTLQGLIIAALVMGLVGLGLAVALGGTLGQGGSAAAAQPAVAATRPPAATAAPAPTVAAVQPRATAVTSAPVSAADAGPAESTGDAAAGATLFASLPAEAIAVGAINCSVCHNIAPGSGTLVGPSLSGIGATAATRTPDLSAAQYLRVSITNPSAYVVEGFTAGAMPATFAAGLTPEQIEDLVAYLLTLP